MVLHIHANISSECQETRVIYLETRHPRHRIIRVVHNEPTAAAARQSPFNRNAQILHSQDCPLLLHALAVVVVVDVEEVAYLCTTRVR
jgi:hypothetical protein